MPKHTDKPASANKSCFDDYDPNSLLVEEALARIKQSAEAVPETENLDIRSALGRVLAQDIESRINVPSHTNSAMDGYAIVGSDIPETGEVKLQTYSVPRTVSVFHISQTDTKEGVQHAAI